MHAAGEMKQISLDLRRKMAIRFIKNIEHKFTIPLMKHTLQYRHYVGVTALPNLK